MFSSHVMSKGMKTLEISDSDSKNFQSKLITEELLYLQTVKNHRSMMSFLALFHLAVIGLVILNSFNDTKVLEGSMFCQHVGVLKDGLYVLFNLAILYFVFQSIRKSRAMLSSLEFYDRIPSSFVLSMALSLSFVALKFAPDFLCANLSLGMFNCALMACHIFIENLALIIYVRWYRTELRSYGALIN